MLRTTTWACALGSLLLPQAHAQHNTSPETSRTALSATALKDTPLQEVTVSATRTARSAQNTPATVTAPSQAQAQQRGARHIKEWFAEELGVSVRQVAPRFTAAGSAAGRAGIEGVNVRGLEGNQVLMAVDGIRLPLAFSFGAFATGRGDYVALEGLRKAEILRGPASTQFGSDGLAGAVNFSTLGVVDVLGPGRNSGGFASARYSSLDRSLALSGSAAAQGEQWSGLLLMSRTQGHETSNQGLNSAQNLERTRPNPLDYRQRYVLGKLGWKPQAAHQLEAHLEVLQRHQNTEVYSARAKPPLQASSVVDLDAQDRVQRQRLSAHHRYHQPQAALLQRAHTLLYTQRADTRQWAKEDRHTASDRLRDNRYDTQLSGMSTQLEFNGGSALDGALRQRLSLGLDWSQARISSVRDGTVPPGGETFPTKPFPDTRFTQSGLFAQSELSWGPLDLIPALRLEQFQLSPSLAGYGGGPVTALRDQAWTPRLGLVWRLAPLATPYAQWAQGFRAPTPDQVNNGFSNVASGYMTLGNPHLKPEHANSLELGVRGHWSASQSQPGAGLRWSLALYDNRYSDFIQQKTVGGTGTVSDPLKFQYVNSTQARIRGAELRLQWLGTQGLSAGSGLAWSRGHTVDAGVSRPLNSVNPLQLQAWLAQERAQWGARLAVQHQRAKKLSDIDATPRQVPFAPPASTVFNLSLRWQATPALTLQAHVDNLFNRRYWLWSDVRGLPANSPVADAYTASGRNARVSLRHDF
ncbi:TonB-dependent hemoglobin/transferrin/lactoferrin family receptor [Roseateles sp. BYS180W]|uniref:TonB-dependent hemoglobin/transferrin/lactoferrin family receptor n=1 Tax=Roseateles rivi TaxID=3299028 RepID=A0ABW7FXS3_9BURK